MRLICGIVRLDGERRMDRTLPDRMLAALSPDPSPALHPQRLCWHGAGAALAVLDFGQTPTLAQRRSGRVLAADVRLDEIPEPLPQLLDHRDASARLAHLLGDFALADWNPATRELLLARDSPGVRPLVYFHRPGEMVAFASFPRALHAVGMPARRVDPSSLIREILGVSGPGETLFHDIRAVEPGTALRFSPAAVHKTVFWKPEPDRRHFPTPEAAAEALRGALEDAVRTRLAGTGPVATHLSGGLDSSAIAVLAARALSAAPEHVRRPLLAYSFLGSGSSGHPLHDERPFVRSVLAQEPSIEWFPIEDGDPLAPGLKLDRFLSDAPDDPENSICAHSSARGASLILSGWGGDEAATFNGRGALADALLRGRWRYLLHEVRALGRVRGFSAASVLRGEIGSYLRADIAFLAHRMPYTASAVAKGPLASLLRPKSLLAALECAEAPVHIGSRVRRNQLALTRGPHLETRTGNWAEIGARFGMAFTFPMLDRRVVDCALSMHSTWHLRGGWKRRPFRDAMRGILPEPIRWRHGKLTPFPETAHVLAGHRETLCREVAELCTHPEVAELFDPARVAALLGQPGHSGQPSPSAGSDWMLPTLLLRSCAAFLTQR